MWDGGGSKSTLKKLDEMLGHVSGYLFWPQVSHCTPCILKIPSIPFCTLHLLLPSITPSQLLSLQLFYLHLHLLPQFLNPLLTSSTPANPKLVVLSPTTNSVPMFLLLTAYLHGTPPLVLVIRWMLPEDSLHPLSNLRLWLSKALSPLTQNPLMVQAPYVLHNFVTNGILPRKLTCLLTMPYYMPSLVNIKAGNLATPSVLGWLA